jgi:hypothetical protein
VKEKNSVHQERNKHIRITLQLIGIAGGLYGLFLVGLSLMYLKDAFFMKTGSTGGYVFSSLWFIGGIYLVYVGYILIIRFSKNAIKHLCFVISFIIAVRLPQFLREVGSIPYSRETEILFQTTSTIIAILFYILSSKLFIKWCSMK